MTIMRGGAAARCLSLGFYQKQNRLTPTFGVVKKTGDGVIISGMKMLATGAVCTTNS